MNEFDPNNNMNPQPENQFAQQNPQMQDAQQNNLYMGAQPQYSAGPAMGGFSPEQAMARANDYSPQTGYDPQGSFPDQGYQQGGYNQQASYPQQQNYNQQQDFGQQAGYQQQGYQQGSYNQQASYPQQQNYNPQGGFQSQLSYADPMNAPQNIPQNPNPEATGKKHIVQISIILAAFLLIALCVVSVFMNWGPFKQSGGRESVSDLMNDYVSALNSGDVDAYMKLIPKAERNDKEKSEVTKAMSKLEYTGGDMTITVGASKSYSDSKKQLVKDKLNKLSAMPVRVDSVQEVNATISGEGYEQHVVFTVIESNGKFFIDDLTEK